MIREELRYRRGTALGPFIPSQHLLKVPKGRQRKSSLPIIIPLHQNQTSSESSSPSASNNNTLFSTSSLSVSPSSLHKFGYDQFDDDENSDSGPPDTLLIESGKRLSAVGLAFGQQLEKFAMRLSTNHQEIVDKTRILCARFVRNKLAKNGLIERHSSLQRLRSMGNIDFDPIIVDLMDQIVELVNEMDKRSPGLFDSVIGGTGSNVIIFTTPERASLALTVILDEIFRSDITWPKIAAMFGVTGALAVDCATKGKHEYLTNLVDTVGNYADGKVGRWIHSQGGWTGLINSYNKTSQWKRPILYLSLLLALIAILITIIWIYY